MADAMEKVGKEGVITVDEGKSTESVLEYTEGMQFDKGYLSPYFLTNPTTLEAVLENALILLHEKKISNLAELLPLLNKVVTAGRPLLIIAEDVEAEALAALVVNKLRGVLNICAVKAPGFGDRRKAMMGDLAAVTGGKFISEDLGLKLENIEVSDLGSAKRIVVDKDNTLIVEGAGKKKDIDARAEQIRTPDRIDHQRLRSREIAGTPGQADRRRGRHQGRRGHRNRNEGAQGSDRRRPARHQGRGRGGHRPRRRRGVPPGHRSRRKRQDQGQGR